MPSVDALCVTPGGIYVDATYGGGGHFFPITLKPPFMMLP